MCDIGKAFSFGDPAFGALTGVGKDKKKRPAPIPGGRYSRAGKRLLEAYEYLLPGTLDVTRKAATGFGDIYRAEAEKTRADELAGFQRYGPEYAAAISGADPMQAALREKTNQIVLGNLDEGLDPSVRREIQQGSRAAWSSRGLLGSPASATEELFALGSRGKLLEEANLQRALQLLEANQRVVGDPFLAYSGRPALPQGSNPQSPNYAGFQDDLFSYGVNREIMNANAAQASKNRQTQLIAAGISALGSIGGGAAGAFI